MQSRQEGREKNRSLCYGRTKELKKKKKKTKITKKKPTKNFKKKTNF
jgi:hypothetical protein